MTAKLRYLAPGVLSKLKESIAENLVRYRAEGFADLAGDGRWGLPLDIEFDAELLETLSDSSGEYESSKIVGRSLATVTPAVANEERLWARLSHVEAIEYSRRRWLSDSASDDETEKSIRTHFFAPSQTGIRDDHALSRLWWNYHIAFTCMPDSPEEALELILRSADIRSNFVERIWMTSRRPLAATILAEMKADPWLTDAEGNFRDFMKSVNRLGGGIVFEALSADGVEKFVRTCASSARQLQTASASKVS